MKFLFCIVLIFQIFFFGLTLSAQDDLEAILEAETEDISIPVTGTFKSTYLQNGPTVEQVAGGELEFRVNHRFGEISEGSYKFFGLDESSSLVSLTYGITDRISFGLSRATIDKCWGATTKISILRQTFGASPMPVSLSYFGEVQYKDLKLPESDPYSERINRLFYTHGLLAARKFSPDFSAQAGFMLIHRNLTESYNDNDIYAPSGGVRYKLTNWIALTGEIYYPINPDLIVGEESLPSYSLGIDIDTGGHVFQLLIANSPYMLPHQFISRSRGQIAEAGLHIGFNLMRFFNITD